LELFPANARKLYNKIKLPTLNFTFQFSFKATLLKLSKEVVYVTVHTISVLVPQSTELLRRTLPYTEINYIYVLGESYKIGYTNTLRYFAGLQQVGNGLERVKVVPRTTLIRKGRRINKGGKKEEEKKKKE
jgi:hypothetical protein